MGAGPRRARTRCVTHLGPVGRSQDMRTVARRRCALLVAALSAAVVLAPPAGAGTVPGRAAPVRPEPRGWDETSGRTHVRRILIDVQNDADPDAERLSRLALVWFVDQQGPSLRVEMDRLQALPASRAAVVDDLFAAVLRREADAPSRSFFVDRLGRVGRRKVMADLLASPEHHARQGGGTDAGWIDALYRDALGRPADAAGRQYFLGQMAAGRSRGSIAAFFTGGTEGTRALVRRLMVELLRRPADAPSVDFYAGRLAAGDTVEQVISVLLASSEYLAKASPLAPDVDAVFLHRGNRLEYRRNQYQTTPSRRIDVSGLDAGDDLVAIDIRPATGGLYGVTEAGQVVSVTPAGVATEVGPPLGGLVTGGVGLDVDPVTDTVVVTSGATARRVDPDTGTAGPVVASAYATGDRHEGEVPRLTGVAFTASARSATPPATATEYAIDVTADALVTASTDGTLVTVGSLHADVGPGAVFDIAPDAPQAAYAVLTVPRAGRALWQIDVATGEPRLLQEVDDSLIGLAVVADPTAPSREQAYGITPGSAPQLHLFPTDDGTPTATWSVTGVAAGTDIVGLDVRPATGGLHGIRSDGQIYAFALPSGGGAATATPVGAPLTLSDADGRLGFEIQPTDDVVRVIDGLHSYRVRVTDGAVLGEGTMALQFDDEPGPPLVLDGMASTHSQRGAVPPPPYAPPGNTDGSARAFHLDLSDGGRVWREQAANPLRLFPVGPLLPSGIDLEGVVGFDITAGYRSFGFALIEVDGYQVIVGIDLQTGRAAQTYLLLTPTPARLYSAFALA